jgi:hypothetical protein
MLEVVIKAALIGSFGGHGQASFLLARALPSESIAPYRSSLLSALCSVCVATSYYRRRVRLRRHIQSWRSVVGGCKSDIEAWAVVQPDSKPWHALVRVARSTRRATNQATHVAARPGSDWGAGTKAQFYIYASLSKATTRRERARWIRTAAPPAPFIPQTMDPSASYLIPAQASMEHEARSLPCDHV